MGRIDQDEQKPAAVPDEKSPAPASSPSQQGTNKPPSDGDAIAELGDELGGPA